MGRWLVLSRDTIGPGANRTETTSIIFFFSHPPFYFITAVKQLIVLFKIQVNCSQERVACGSEWVTFFFSSKNEIFGLTLFYVRQFFLEK